MRDSIVNSPLGQETTLREAYRGIESDVFSADFERDDNHLVYNPYSSYKTCSKGDTDKDYAWSNSIAERTVLRDSLRDLAKQKALDGERYYWRSYKSLNNCHLYPKVDAAGNPTVHNHTCGCARCPVCGVVAQKKMYFNTMDAITQLIKLGQGPVENKQRWHWVTLTQRHRSKNLFSEALKLKKSFNNLKNRRYWRRLTSGPKAGCVWRIEYTNKNGWHNLHIHFLLLTEEPMTTNRLESELKKEWSKCGGGFVRVKRVRAERTDIIKDESGEQGRAIGMTKVLNELVKYSLKPTEVSLEDHLDFFQAHYKRPLTGFIGIFKKLIATKEDWKETPEREEEVIPEPPSKVHPVTGEIANLKEGIYSFPDLFRRAYRLGEWSALWCLRMLRYRQKYVAPGLIQDWIDTKERLKE